METLTQPKKTRNIFGTLTGVIEAVKANVDYPKQVEDLKLVNGYGGKNFNAVRFTYRGQRFEVDRTGRVEEIKQGGIGATVASEFLQKILRTYATAL